MNGNKNVYVQVRSATCSSTPILSSHKKTSQKSHSPKFGFWQKWRVGVFDWDQIHRDAAVARTVGAEGALVPHGAPQRCCPNPADHLELDNKTLKPQAIILPFVTCQPALQMLRM
eukprot:6472805-Amphidinium_carterae.2